MTKPRISITIDDPLERHAFREATGQHGNQVLYVLIQDLTYLAETYGELAMVNIKDRTVSLRDAYEHFVKEISDDARRIVSSD
jgi:hypothetical protein